MDGAQSDPPGFHLIPLPYADDMRAVPEQFLDAERGKRILRKMARLRWLIVAICHSRTFASYPAQLPMS